MKRLAISCILASLVMLAAPALAQQQGAAPTLSQTLAPVRWHGRTPSPEMVEGKAALVLVYATWCPKCNQWSPDFFTQVQQAAVNLPVVVFAINADKRSPGPQYAAQHGFAGPNIFHGSDPTIVQRLGFDSELFKYALFDEEGALVERGNGGSAYSKPTGKAYAIAADMPKKAGSLGEFKILGAEMPPAIKQALWPVELGADVSDKQLLKLREKLPEEDRGVFNEAIHEYLVKQIDRCREWSSGDLADQIKAYNAAKKLAADFGSTPQGRQAAAYVEKMDAQSGFEREVAAAAYYKRVVDAADSPAELKRALARVARRSEGTHYGKLAAERLQSESLTQAP